ncbi:hypothetical protein FB451DRAFT_504969 [Mycena latifolia]|nr:hypothetical protein FB451DRAFT_504969 [Mycena latifolia]
MPVTRTKNMANAKETQPTIDESCKSVPQNWEYNKVLEARVSKTLDSRRSRRVWEYLVDWKQTEEETWEPSWQKIGCFPHPSVVDSFWKVAKTGGRDSRDIYLFKENEIIERGDDEVQKNGAGSESDTCATLRHAPGPGRSSAGYMGARVPNPNATKVYALFDNGFYYPGRIASQVSKNVYVILFDDGLARNVEVKNLREHALREGDTVEVSSDRVLLLASTLMAAST